MSTQAEYERFWADDAGNQYIIGRAFLHFPSSYDEVGHPVWSLSLPGRGPMRDPVAESVKARIERAKEGRPL